MAKALQKFLRGLCCPPQSPPQIVVPEPVPWKSVFGARSGRLYGPYFSEYDGSVVLRWGRLGHGRRSPRYPALHFRK